MLHVDLKWMTEGVPNGGTIGTLWMECWTVCTERFERRMERWTVCTERFEWRMLNGLHGTVLWCSSTLQGLYVIIFLKHFSRSKRLTSQHLFYINQVINVTILRSRSKVIIWSKQGVDVTLIFWVAPIWTTPNLVWK
jgi:hypothetical protein